MSEYITCAETAKLLRNHLKRAFPGVKFSVVSKTYSGGASINVNWTDGPTTKEVEAVSGNYSGSNFDGMIDLKYSNDSWLMPDGTIQFARTQGTEGGRGTHASVAYAKPHQQAKLVSLHADFVFANRHYTPEFIIPIMQRVCKEYGHPELAMTPYGDFEDGQNMGNGYYRYMREIVWREIQTVSGYTAPVTETKPVGEAEAIGGNAENEPATSRQLWALHCITKMDTRGWDVSKASASDLISRAKRGVDITPIVKEFVL